MQCNSASSHAFRLNRINEVSCSKFNLLGLVMTLCKASDLKNPRDLLAWRGRLPGLIRKLVIASVPDSSIINIPAFDQVHRPGFDGTVKATIDHPIVPDGLSVWEIGTNSESQKKANEDYRTRTDDKTLSDSLRRTMTYVAVTSREWQEKRAWCEKKRKEEKWKDVVAFDCDDIEHWLERHRHVDLWLAALLQLPCQGLIDFSQQWTDLRAIAKYPLRPELFLVGNESASQAIQAMLADKPSSALLRCSSVQDGVDFLTALHASTTDRSPLQRMLQIEDKAAWAELSTHNAAMTLIVPSIVPLKPEEVQRAVNAGHHVLIVGQQNASVSIDAVQLGRQNVYEVEDQLARCGFSASKAKQAAFGSAGSSSVVKRLISDHPATLLPSWASEQNRSSLAPYALIGAWDQSPPPAPEFASLFGSGTADRSLLADFLRKDEGSIDGDVTRWSLSDEPLFARIGEEIFVCSRELSWYLLAQSLTRDVRERFITFASLVLGDEDPSFELPPDQRWAAAMYGKSLDCSKQLREGVIQTLALMNSMPVTDTAGKQIDFESDVRRIIENILPPNAAWQTWATLDRFLPMLCEAAPELVFSKIENDLTQDNSKIEACFREGTTGAMGRRHHCGLLWGLEIAAWNPSLLPRVTSILVKLVDIENLLPKNFGNRPSNSLRGIFDADFAGTAASADEKLSILRHLASKYPDGCWRLVLSLIQKFRESKDPTELPRWREWADSHDTSRFLNEHLDYVVGIVDIAEGLAESNASRWQRLLQPLLFFFTDEIANRCLRSIGQFANGGADAHQIADLWLEIESVLDWQLRIDPSSENRLDDKALNLLRSERDRLTPSDPRFKHLWLFNEPKTVAGVDQSDDFEEYHKELFRQQRAAVREIHEEGGDDAVIRLCDDEQRLREAALASGAEDVLSPKSVFDLLDSDKDTRRQLASYYLHGLYVAKRIRFLDEWRVDQLPVETIARILLTLNSRPDVWAWIDAQNNTALTRAYWSKVGSHAFVESERDLKLAIDNFLKHDRPFAACQLLRYKNEKFQIDDELIAEVLYAGFSCDTKPPAGDVDAYSIQELVARLQKSAVGRGAVAEIEWGYIEILTDSQSQTHPKTLLSEARRSPAFFHKIVSASWARRAGEGNSVESAVAIESRRSQARKLLSSLVELPGETDGSIDEANFRTWIDELRESASDDDEWEKIALELGSWLGRRCLDGETGKIHDLPEVFRMLEQLRSEEVKGEFVSAICNGRGATCRDPFAGGDQEKNLERHFDKLATHYGTEFPQVSECFRHLARHYAGDAERHDQQAEKLRLNRL